MIKSLPSRIALIATCFSLTTLLVVAEKPASRVYGKARAFQIQELPAGKLKAKLETLNPQAKEKAMKWLHEFTFETLDAEEHLRADDEGGIFIVCPDGHSDAHTQLAEPTGTETAHASVSGGSAQLQNTDRTTGSSESLPAAHASVPISSPPKYNSKPGATRHIYIDFNGGLVSGKAWSAGGITSWNCEAWSTDTDKTTFSDAEQSEIRRAWERLSEDYSSFDVNVTTDVAYDPDQYTGDKNNVGWLMCTPTTDKNGAHCPHYGYGGIAYVGVYGDTNYFSKYQPAWVAPYSAANLIEAASHEMGHNMGLSHDGTSSQSYYGGHSGTASAPSWGPIMGTGYGQNVTQWSKGEYYNSNQPQDDLSIISARVPYRIDDHGDTSATATFWITSPINQSGLVETTNNADYFKFNAAAGPVSLSASPYRCDTSTWGGNLDIILELYDSSLKLVASSNPAAETTASISTSVSGGTYYLALKPSAAGTPNVASPSGYTIYGSLGQYKITGNFLNADAIYVTSPIGGERWQVGTTKNITWSSQMGGNVKIELWQNNSFLRTITSSTPNNGTYGWNIPENQTAANNYKIRISSVEKPGKFDISAADFSIIPPTIYYASMNSNPGWTLDPGWEYGQPSGGNQDTRGFSDPTEGVNGPKVIGYRLDGDYESNIDKTRWATTPAFNCTNRQGVILNFERWLGVEGKYDRAFIEVSNDGTKWVRIWKNSTIAGTKNDDGEWVNFEYDISSVADGKSKVYVRWGMGGSDSLYNYCGWNIDEVYVSGNITHEPEIAMEQPVGEELVDGKTTTDFGLAFVGSKSSTKTYTITNVGNRNLTGLNVVIDGANSNDFSVGGLSASKLAPGTSTSFNIIFSPSKVGERHAFIQIASNDRDEGIFDIKLTGIGMSPEIGVTSPGFGDLIDGKKNIGFGQVILDTTVTKSFTIKNTGTAWLKNITVKKTGPNAKNFRITQPPVNKLAPRTSTTFTVDFTPTAMGKRIAEIQIINNDPNENPFNIALVGFGTAPEIAVKNSNGKDLADGKTIIDFGSVKVKSSVSKAFTIKNLGSAWLKNLEIKKSGVYPSNYNVTQPGKKALAPGASTTFTITFVPSYTGTRNAEIKIISNDKNENPFDIALTGYGAAKPSASLALSSVMGPQSLMDLYLTDEQSESTLGPESLQTYTTEEWVDGMKYLALSVKKPESGILFSYHVEVSPNLLDWYSGSKHTTIMQDDEEWLKVRDNTPVNADIKRYIRLK